MSRGILLTQGKIAVVDWEEYDNLIIHKWCFDGRYARANIKINGKWKLISMHKLIMNTPKGMVTDHINGDKLDNRKSNLRICTSQQNSHNSGPHKDKDFKLKGVYWDKQHKKWEARILNKRIGFFTTLNEAVKIYNLTAKKYFGEFARLNKI